MHQVISFLDRHRWPLAALVFILTFILFNSCATLPTRRDRESDMPLPVRVVREI